MKTKSIEAYGRIDVDEVTLPTWDELNANGSPIIDAWTGDSCKSMGYMLKLTMRTDSHRNDFTERYPKEGYGNIDRINHDGYIYPLFIIPELTSIGHKVFVGNIMCTVVSKSRALADWPVCRDFINETAEFNWIEGWDLKKSHIYQYLNSDEFWESVDPDSSSQMMAEEFGYGLGESSRLFDDPDYDRVIGISYNAQSTDGGSFVFESYPYSVIFEGMRLYGRDDEDAFLDYVFDNRDNDRFADKGSDRFVEFANEWKDRTDYGDWSADTFAKYAMSHIGSGWENFIND